jgi:zinc protease
MNAIQLVAARLAGACAIAVLTPAVVWAAIPIQHWTQANGAKVYLVESPAIPMVDVRVEIDAGSRRDPTSKAGLASVMAGTMTDGVRATATEPALDENGLSEAWADLGASFSASAGADRLSFSLRSLTYPDLLQKATALAARQIAQPAFPEATWLRDRPKLIASIKDANTRPATIAGRAFASAVYGSHPYGAETTEGSLMRITVRDMAALHASVVRPCYAKVSIVGALNREQADALVAQLLARLPTGGSSLSGASHCPALPAVPEVQPLLQAKEQSIAFASAQAHVLVGQPGYPRNDPDHFALMVGNHILGGGGFTSRLTEEVREKRGLTYGVYSYFSPGLHAGAFTVGLQTRPDQAQQALQLVRQEIARFVKDGPTEKELQAAKDNLIGGFPLLLDGNRKLLDNVANMAWNNLPLDYLDNWTQRVQQLTTEDIRAAFARKLQPEKMVTVVLGAQP